MQQQIRDYSDVSSLGGRVQGSSALFHQLVHTHLPRYQQQSGNLQMSLAAGKMQRRPAICTHPVRNRFATLIPPILLFEYEFVGDACSAHESGIVEIRPASISCHVQINRP